MKCLRIYADESGESHLADIDIPLNPVNPSPGTLHLSAPYAASSVRFAWAPPGIPEGVGWHGRHVAPARQLVILLTGWLEFETSDGDKRRGEPGTVILAEDTFGKGHLTRGPGEQFALFVPVPDGFSVSPSSEGIKR